MTLAAAITRFPRLAGAITGFYNTHAVPNARRNLFAQGNGNPTAAEVDAEALTITIAYVNNLVATGQIQRQPMVLGAHRDGAGGQN